MSIIKCPECNNEVSTSAEKCPHCGVRISGNIKTCPDCGKVVLRTESSCPACGASLQNTPVMGLCESEVSGTSSKKRKPVALIVLIVLIVLAAIGAGGYFYVTDRERARSEQEAYENVISAKDTALCSQYLADYPEGAHVIEVKALLAGLVTEINDWNDACVNRTRGGFLRFLSNHNGSAFEQACNDKIDSLDYVEATILNTVEAYDIYLRNHPDGLYAEQARQGQGNVVQGVYEKKIKDVCKSFFTSLSTRDYDKLSACVTDVMDNFLNKKNATEDDVKIFAQKLWQSNPNGLKFTVNNDFQIRRTDNNKVNEPEYDVNFTVNKTAGEESSDNNVSETFAVMIHVNETFCISSLGMLRLASKNSQSEDNK